MGFWVYVTFSRVFLLCFFGFLGLWVCCCLMLKRTAGERGVVFIDKVFCGGNRKCVSAALVVVVAVVSPFTRRNISSNPVPLRRSGSPILFDVDAVLFT